MERREFIKQCGSVGFSCLGLSVLLNSCKTVPHLTGTVNNNKIQISRSEFVIQKEGKTTYRKYLIMKVESLDFPIVVYRFSDKDYKALLLRCTHQSNELNVSGDLISCPAHGSEFSNKGDIVQGPADQALKAFPISMDESTIYIELT